MHAPPLPSSTPRPCRARRRERGSALVVALVMGIFVATMVFQGEFLGRATSRRLSVEYAAKGQAPAVAEAGLTDALAWMRRQTLQPVLAFTPRRDLAGQPAVNETDDPSLGLVREFEISPGIWGRYEVRRGRPMDPFVDANGNGVWDDGESFTDFASPPDGTARAAVAVAHDTAGAASDGYADDRWTPARWTRDVSEERGYTAAGTVWRLESRGFVFVRPRADLRLGEGPNRLLGSSAVATEARRLVMAPPAAAALCAASEGSVELGTRVRVRADQLAIGVGSADGSIVKTTSSELLAPSQSAVIPGYKAGVTDVFGVDWAELKAMAEVSTQRLMGVPDRVNDYDLVVLERDVAYDDEQPLLGLGVLVVRGNLTISAGSSSFFTGLIYVTGTVTVDGPAFFRGTIIAGGKITLRGTTGDYVEVEYDSGTVSRLLADMGHYRFARAAYVPDRDLVDTASVSVAAPVETPTSPGTTSGGTTSGGTTSGGTTSGGTTSGGTTSGGTTSGSTGKSWWSRRWSGWGDHDEDHDYRDTRHRRKH